MTFQNKGCTAFTKQHMAVGLRTLTENIHKFNNAYQNSGTFNSGTFGTFNSGTFNKVMSRDMKDD